MSAFDPATLPPVMSIAAAGDLLGVSRATAYEYARVGDIQTISFNGRLTVPTAGLLEKLGIAYPGAQSSQSRQSNTGLAPE